MISIQQVTHQEGDRKILESISINLNAKRIAVIGANGSGKSTFARLINGLVVPTEGKVEVNGLDTRTRGAALRREVGFVFQNPDIQFVFPTVEEDLAFGLKNLGFNKIQIKQKISDTLACYGLQHTRYQSVHTLSGGEKQLLCVAAVLIMQPKIIVFDEPTTLLDLANRGLINQTIAALPQQSVVVTHDLEYASQCEFAVLLDHGKLAAGGTPDEVIKQYLELVENNTGCNPPVIASRQ